MALFPVFIQRNRTLGWPPVKKASPRVLSLICGLRERYLAAELALPTLTWRGQHPLSGSYQDWQDFASKVVENATVEEMSNFLLQINLAIIALDRVYVDLDYNLITGSMLEDLGVKPSGVLWPRDVTGTIQGLQALQYLPKLVRAINEDFTFAGYVPMGKGLYAEWSSPFKTVDGKQIMAWKIAPDSSTKFGDLAIGFDNTPAFHAPVRLTLFSGPQYEYGYVECDSSSGMTGDQVVTASGVVASTGSQTFPFTISKQPDSRYFLSDAGGAPWFAAVGSLTLNGHSIFQDTFEGYYDVTDLVVNGSNSLVLSYNGTHAWSDIWLSSALFASSNSDTYPPSAFTKDGKCYELSSVLDTSTGVVKPFGPPWREQAVLKIDGAVNQNFVCFPPLDQAIERPHITAAPDLVEAGMPVLGEIAPPANASNYVAHLTQAIDVPGLPPIVAEHISAGSVTHPVTQFDFITPNIPPHTYFIAAEFDTGDVVKSIFNVVAEVCGYGYDSGYSVGGSRGVIEESSINVLDLINPSESAFTLSGQYVV